MICESDDVVAVPFPFADGPGAKRRPALVVSRKPFNEAGHTVMAMVTTRARPPWPGDSEIKDFSDAGLHLPCLARLKLFTLDNRLIVKRLGRLSAADAGRVRQAQARYIFEPPPGLP